MRLTVDLNCDMGEGCANDAALMDYVSSVNIACGFHAGDANTMRRTVETAIEKGVAIGAHPGYRDRDNFGRTPMHLPLDEVRDIVTEQVNALRDVCGEAGATMRHIKPHGALYNQAVRDADLGRVIAQAVADIDKDLVYFGLSGSLMIDEAQKVGLLTASEVFADRTYASDGSLTPRTELNALIHETNAAVTQALDMIKYGRVRTIDGIMVNICADTVCLHGDAENALEFARAIYEALSYSGIAIRPVLSTLK
jgi:UPF0271 protein